MSTESTGVDEALATLEAVDWHRVEGISPAEVGAFVARVQEQTDER